jgi:squalene-hopene/tetraprenyl-beta-curcumene cyclase
LPFDRSAPDLTAHALRALHAWKHLFPSRRIEGAIARGLEYLAHQQRPDGSWLPLWFGNENWPGELNPVYGTSRVLLAYRDLGLMAAPAARRGVQWLVAHQGADGGWGGPPDQEGESSKGLSSVEETAVAVEALLSSADDPAVRPALAAGVGWLVEAVESGRHRETAPIGLYFAKLWYYERVYPLVFTVAALGSAVQRYASESP